MSAMSSVSSADLLKLDPATWKPQALHSGERVWLETNCYIDVWAELLPALGYPAEAALAFTVRQDFEGDHFTFFKFPLEDLETLFGLAVQELAIYDTLEGHTLEQLGRGRPVLIEVDSHWLPDAGPTYRKGHVKTTVAAIAIDPAARRFGYFHNTGYHVLEGEDYDGLFRKSAAPDALFPYVEFVKRDGRALQGAALVLRSLDVLRGHLKHRPASNPVAAWRAAMPAQAANALSLLLTAIYRVSSAPISRCSGPISTGWVRTGRLGLPKSHLPPVVSRRRRKPCSSNSPAWSIAAGSMPRSFNSARSRRTMSSCFRPS